MLVKVRLSVGTISTVASAPSPASASSCSDQLSGSTSTRVTSWPFTRTARDAPASAPQRATSVALPAGIFSRKRSCVRLRPPSYFSIPRSVTVLRTRLSCSVPPPMATS